LGASSPFVQKASEIAAAARADKDEVSKVAPEKEPPAALLK